MDRVEFIEMLQEKLDEQRKIYDELVLEKEKKYKYTTKYFYDRIKPKELTSMKLIAGDDITITRNYLWDNNANTYTGSKTTTTTDMIIETSYKIRKLELECDSIRKEIEAFDDVRKIFPFLEDK